MFLFNEKFCQFVFILRAFNVRNKARNYIFVLRKEKHYALLSVTSFTLYPHICNVHYIISVNSVIEISDTILFHVLSNFFNIDSRFWCDNLPPPNPFRNVSHNFTLVISIACRLIFILPCLFWSVELMFFT